jgi:hypothetical protein
MTRSKQDASGDNYRLFISLQHRKPGPGLAFRFGTRRPRRGPHRKIRFAPSMERLGKVVPPHAKIRQPPQTARPLDNAARAEGYALQGRLATPAQNRRERNKLGHAQRAGRPMPVTALPLAKTPPGTHQPHSFEMSRGFRKMLGRLPRAQRARAIAAWQAQKAGR